MRFYCNVCDTYMHDSLINGEELKKVKQKIIPVANLRCPFCHFMNCLEVKGDD